MENRLKLPDSLTTAMQGAGSNARDIIVARKEYNDYVSGGGPMSFEEFMKDRGKNANPYKR